MRNYAYWLTYSRNTLIADDCINNSHPVGTLTDAAQHMAGKKFCKLDCSRAYHCLQMVDQQSIELAYNFASRIFAYRRLPKRISRSLSTFLSFISNISIPSSKPTSAHKKLMILAWPTTFLNNWTTTYEQSSNVSVKLAVSTAWPNATSVYEKKDLLTRTKLTKGVDLGKREITKLLGKVYFPRSKKALQRQIGFPNYYQNYTPRLVERLALFFQQLEMTEAKAKIPTGPDIMKNFRERNKALHWCCQLALRQPLPGKQLVLLTDRSFRAAGFAVLIKHDANQKYTSTCKNSAPTANGSKVYTLSQIRISI